MNLGNFFWKIGEEIRNVWVGWGGGEEITDFGQNILAKLLLSREPLSSYCSSCAKNVSHT